MKYSYHATIILALGIFLLPVGRSSSQSESDPQPTPAPTPPPLSAYSATIYISQDNTVQLEKHDSTFDRVALNPGQTVTVALQYDATAAGQAVMADALDGGTITVPEGGLVIDGNGVLTFQFQAGTAPGSCRVSIHQAGDGDKVQFWVINQAQPADNPPELPDNN